MSKVAFYCGGLAIAFMGSCGPAKTPNTNDQQSPPLVIPEYNADADPLRQEDFQGLKLSGSVVVWSENPSPEAMQAVITAATDMRYRKADLKRFTVTNIKPLRAEIFSLRDTLVATEREADANKDDLETVALYAASWFSSTLEAWRKDGSITEDEQAAAEEVFGAYCEAKIWELATDQTFVIESYRKRPTPFQLCHDYYEAHGLLAETTPECAPDAKGKNYFSCLWQQGVMRTRFFVDRYEADQVAKISQWTSSADAVPHLQSLLRSPETSQLVRIGAMDQRRVAPLGNDRYLFRPITGTPVAEPDMLLAHASPTMVIRAVEYGPLADTPKALMMFPWPEDRERLETFYEDIQTLGERQIGTPSVNDYRFHEPLGEKTEPAGYQYAKQRQTLKFIFDNRSPPYKKKIAALADALANKQDVLQDLERQSAVSYLQPLARSMELSAEAANADGVSAGLWISSLLKLEVEDEHVTVSFFLDSLSGDAAKACLDRLSLAPITCPDANATLAHDAVSGALTLTIPLQDPETFGINLTGDDVATPNSSFSHIDPNAVTGKSMRLVLYPNVIEGVLLYYSGKMFIEDVKEGVLYEGAVNLLEDI